MARSIVGVDISARRLLAAEVETAGKQRPVLLRAAGIELSDGVANDSEVIDIPAVTAALEQLWKNARFGSKRVVLGVGNQRVLVRDHTVSELPPAQLRQALPYQVDDLLPVPVNDTILDFYPIERVEGSSPPQMRGLLVAAIKENVETNVTALLDAGLTVVGVDLTPFAIVRALSSADASVGAHTIVAIGAGTTHIIVIDGGIPQFVRIVPVGSENVTDALVSKHGLSRSDAEILKYRIGFQSPDDPQYAAASEAMLTAFASVFSAIRSTNSYYQTNYSDAPIESLIFTGAESRMPGIADVIAERVGVPVTLGDPFTRVRVAKTVDAAALAEFQADLAGPIGLAMGGGTS